MGAVICNSNKTTSHEECERSQSEKSLRRKFTKDSIYDSSDFVECSSLIYTDTKEKIKRMNKCDVHSSTTAQLESNEIKMRSCSAIDCRCSICRRNECSSKSSQKLTTTQRFFKHAWSRKHKTYSSGSTQTVRTISYDNQSSIKVDPIGSEIKPPETTYKESDAQTYEDVKELKDSSTTTACFDHLTSYLTFEGKCGLCDFVHSGRHHRWNSLEDDAAVFKEVSKNLTAWLQKTSKFRNKIVLNTIEPDQKVRIILRKDKSGVQEILVIDGNSSFQIQVANPPENPETTATAEEDEDAGNASAAPESGSADSANNNDEEQVAGPSENTSTENGEAMVVRRMNPRGGQLLRSKAQEGDSLDQADCKFPPVDTVEACNKAAERLREMVYHLQHGEVPISVLQKSLQYAACVLDTVCIDDTSTREPDTAEKKSHLPSQVFSTILSFFNYLPGQLIFSPERTRTSENSVSTAGPSQISERPPVPRRQFTRLMSKNRRTLDEDDELSEFHPNAVPTEVREWLASTFSKKTATVRKRSEDKPRFRSVANAIRAGIMVDRLYRRMSNSTLFYIPTHISLYLKGLDEYSFDVFSLNEKANGQGLRYLAYDLLNRYGLTHKFKISSSTIENFMTQVLHGYVRHKNPYHNDLHAADVTQTVHYMLCQQGLANWLTDLEIFAAIIAAIIHDFEHTGTTNNFHIMSRSETALLYNDRAVLENHHVSTAFRLMREEECNILSHLSKEEFKEFRTLVIDMVLATDMSSHFQQIKSIKSLISHSDFNIEKSKALSLVLHCCDISHPSKIWDLHHKWTLLLMEEFFLQGDKEKALGLPYSPLCDRNTTLIAESQIGFIDFIVAPSLDVCGGLLEKIEQKTQSNTHSPAIAEYANEESAPAENSVASTLRRKSQCLTGALANAIRRDNSPESTPPPTTPAEPSTSAPSSPKTQSKTKVKRPWVFHLEDNKTKWRERTHKDAELRAQLSVVHDDANSDKSEPPMRVIV